MGQCNAWLRILAHALNWHKTEDEILPNYCSLLPTLLDFRIPNKEVEMTREII